MAAYRLTEDAKHGLRRIYLYGWEQWGEAAADRYHDALYDRFEEIAERPNSYPAVDEIRKGIPMQCVRCGLHLLPLGR